MQHKQIILRTLSLAAQTAALLRQKYNVRGWRFQVCESRGLELTVFSVGFCSVRNCVCGQICRDFTAAWLQCLQLEGAGNWLMLDSFREA